MQAKDCDLGRAGWGTCSQTDYGEVLLIVIACEICAERPAVAVLDGQYLCGACGLDALDEQSELRVAELRYELSVIAAGVPSSTPQRSGSPVLEDD